jgi:hypothetical protein
VELKKSRPGNQGDTSQRQRVVIVGLEKFSRRITGLEPANNIKKMFR